jgi:ABC-type transport system substrate-binding protein
VIEELPGVVEALGGGDQVSAGRSLHRVSSSWITWVVLAALYALAATGARASADPAKVIHVAFEAADDGFDLARTTNGFSVRVGEAIFETLLSYDYLARPAKLVPLTAEAMPEVSADGKTYTFHLKRGIYFTTDPAFNGVRRELTAQDYAYTMKRLMDPATRAQSAHFVEGKIVGLDALAARAKKTGTFDYDAALEGIETPDRYTLRVRLTRPDYNFLYVAANSSLGAVAREVIEAYGEDTGRHPVGTGPYLLKGYVPRSSIVLQANPDYRGYVWDFTAGEDARDQRLARDMRGKQMPQIGRVDIAIIEEEQARWLAFQGGQLDLDKLPQVAAPGVLNGLQLKPEFAGQGIELYRVAEADVDYTYFNFRDPVVGGYTQDRIALRRAIAMSYSVPDEIVLIRRNQAIQAEMVVPEGVIGHDTGYRNSIPYDPDLANRLLDRFGYRRGAGGYRVMPDGKPLLIRLRMQPDSTSRQNGELWKRSLDRIGLRLEITISEFADSGKAAAACKLPMWQREWTADYPEAENFLQLFYGPNAGQGNYACYQSPAFDELYRQMVGTPPGLKRNRLVAEMNRQIEADTVWVLHFSLVSNWLVRPWVKGFKRHPILQSDWKYLDVEKRWTVQ